MTNLVKKAEPMFNVDRWEIYSKQLANRDPRQLAEIAWGILRKMTPKQIRRCKKKAGKNKDYSIGFKSRCGKCKAPTNQYSVDLSSYLCDDCDWDFWVWYNGKSDKYTYAEFLEGK